MLVSGIDHVQIAAPERCEAAARNFFGSLLGLEEIEKPEPLRSRGGCWFKVGSGQLHIGVEEHFRPATKAHPAFAVSDVESVCAVLKQAGVPCAWDEELPGVRRFYASDPWGNRLEFTESTAGEFSNVKSLHPSGKRYFRRRFIVLAATFLAACLLVARCNGQASVMETSSSHL